MNRRTNGIKLALLLLLCSCAATWAQRTTFMRINEVLVVNHTNFVNNYGTRSSWIELFNNSPATVNIGGCYLTNDPKNPTLYMIPKGDVLTRIPPRQHTLFWADAQATRGTFHVNFTLDPQKENYLAFYDSDGKTKIDEIIIPSGQQPDISYGLLVDGLGTDWKNLTKVTPSTNNRTLDTNEKLENFQRNDSFGLGMTLTAMVVVFIGLIILYIAFKIIGKIAVQSSHKRAVKASGGAAVKEADPESGEILAAIAAALYEVTEDVHDIENTVLTINKVARNYSPWSSKIYGLRDFKK